MLELEVCFVVTSMKAEMLLVHFEIEVDHGEYLMRAQDREVREKQTVTETIGCSIRSSALC